MDALCVVRLCVIFSLISPITNVSTNRTILHSSRGLRVLASNNTRLHFFNDTGLVVAAVPTSQAHILDGTTMNSSIVTAKNESAHARQILVDVVSSSMDDMVGRLWSILQDLIEKNTSFVRTTTAPPGPRELHIDQEQEFATNSTSASNIKADNIWGKLLGLVLASKNSTDFLTAILAARQGALNVSDSAADAANFTTTEKNETSITITMTTEEDDWMNTNTSTIFNTTTVNSEGFHSRSFAQIFNQSLESTTKPTTAHFVHAAATDSIRHSQQNETTEPIARTSTTLPDITKPALSAWDIGDLLTEYISATAGPHTRLLSPATIQQSTTTISQITPTSESEAHHPLLITGHPYARIRATVQPTVAATSHAVVQPSGSPLNGLFPSNQNLLQTVLIGAVAGFSVLIVTVMALILVFHKEPLCVPTRRRCLSAPLLFTNPSRSDTSLLTETHRHLELYYQVGYEGPQTTAELCQRRQSDKGGDSTIHRTESLLY